MAFTQITLTAGSGYRLATGATPSLVRVRARPAVEMTNGTKVVRKEVIIPIASNGTATKTLAATTDPATTPSGNAYHFNVEIDGVVVRSFTAELPHDAGSTVSIDDLVELDAAPALTAQYDLVVLTQAAYNALPSPDAHTLYVVIG